MTLALRYAAMSHVGLLRTGNEDSVYAGPRLLAVADGMGGHAAGEVASAVAIAAVAELDEDAPGADLIEALRAAAVGANDHLRDMVHGDAALDGMGTTLTTLLFTGSRLGLLHIGDSRAYLLRDGQLSQITHDDTLVQSLVDEGRISPEEASSHPQRNMILRALDGRTDVEFDLSVREARVGDRYLLCSDGLTGPVGRETLQHALAEPGPQDAVERLVELALRGGGPDNITVIVADVVDGPSTGTAVVAGAAAESPQAPPEHLSGHAAGRAAASKAEPAMAGPVAAEPGAPAAPRARRSRRRVAVLGAALVVLLAVLAGTGYAWVRTQWYVGSDGQAVSVFRGLSGSIAGVELSRRQERTALQVSALSELDRQGVQRGISADGRQDAQRIIARLVEHATACPSTTPDSSGGTAPTPAPSPTPPAAGCPTPGDTTGAAPSPTPTPSAGLTSSPSVTSTALATVPGAT